MPTVDIRDFGATGEPGSDSTDAILRAVNRAAVTALETGEEVVVAIRDGTHHATETIYLPEGVGLEISGCRFGGGQCLTFLGRNPHRCVGVKEGVILYRQGEAA